VKKYFAVLVLLVAIGIWLWRCAPSNSPSEADLRATTGINAEVVATRATAQGVIVTCRVRNTTTRAAAQVVLNVVLQDARGQTVAANPLASVADLIAGQTRGVDFVVPVRESQSDCRARVEVSLVRWSN
jgi:hypothetical protein